MDRNIACGSECQSAPEERGAASADALAQRRFCRGLAHRRYLHALRKKSGVPKLPDLRASATCGPDRLRVQGTPGSISGPIDSALTPSALTAAPDVSPPATRMRVKPCAGSMAATEARASRPGVPTCRDRACPAPRAHGWDRHSNRQGAWRLQVGRRASRSPVRASGGHRRWRSDRRGKPAPRFDCKRDLSSRGRRTRAGQYGRAPHWRGDAEGGGVSAPISPASGRRPAGRSRRLSRPSPKRDRSPRRQWRADACRSMRRRWRWRGRLAAPARTPGDCRRAGVNVGIGDMADLDGGLTLQDAAQIDPASASAGDRACRFRSTARR